MNKHDGDAANVASVAVPIVVRDDKEWLAGARHFDIVVSNLADFGGNELDEGVEVGVLDLAKAVPASKLVSKSFEVCSIFDDEGDELPKVGLINDAVRNAIVIDESEEDVLELGHDVGSGSCGVGESFNEELLMTAGGGIGRTHSSFPYIAMVGLEMVHAVGGLAIGKSFVAVVKTLGGIGKANAADVSLLLGVRERFVKEFMDNGTILLNIKAGGKLEQFHVVPDHGAAALWKEHNRRLLVGKGIRTSGKGSSIDEWLTGRRGGYVGFLSVSSS